MCSPITRKAAHATTAIPVGSECLKARAKTSSTWGSGCRVSGCENAQAPETAEPAAAAMDALERRRAATVAVPTNRARACDASGWSAITRLATTTAAEAAYSERPLIASQAKHAIRKVGRTTG